MKYSDFKKFLVGFPPLDRIGAWNIVQDWMYTCDTPPISPRRREQAQDSLSLLQIYTPKTKKMIDEIPIQIRSTPSVSTQSLSTPSVSTQSLSTPSVSTQSRSTPSVSTQSRSTPSLSTQSLSTQSVSTPSASTPNTPQNETTPKRKNEGKVIQLSSISYIEASNQSFQPDLLVINQPKFVIYKDPELINTEQAGGLNKVQVDRLVRTTITNMQTKLTVENHLRTPTCEELTEMAKALTLTFPSLLDALESHEEFLDKLIRRVYNDPCCKAVNEAANEEKRRRKVADGDPSKNQDESRLNMEVPESQKEVFTDDVADDVPKTSAKNIAFERFKGLLRKECNKKNGNPKAICLYLNKTFEGRRYFLESLKASTKKSPANIVAEFIQEYPAFKYPIEIVNEVGRINKTKEFLTEDGYMNVCTQRLQQHLDNIIYFGMSKHAIKPPKQCSSDGKLLHMLTYLPTIFTVSKRVVKKKLIIEIENHEDPEKVVGKLQSSHPILVVDNSKAPLLVHKTIVFTEENISRAIVALVATFYMLNVDYPQELELCLTILQFLLFEDFQAPASILNQANEHWKCFQDYILDA
ncbi:uncharacterized protein [Clytia hemisphaerica]|uniref:Uncharacterized protein n=1 Tax=Clytia hemisphaerica TaxID=252671 RepID=A0A7M5TQV8_9CNID